MILYYGSINKIDHFDKSNVAQNVNKEIDTIGFWLTSDIQAAKPFAIGTETVIEKSETEFWDDGEPKVVQVDRPVRGFIYRVYIDEPNLKEYRSNSGDSYDLFMSERDKYCDYLGNKTWKDNAILLNKEEANAGFRKKLIQQGYEGFVIRDTRLENGSTDFYCIFSEDSLHIADIFSIDAL